MAITSKTFKVTNIVDVMNSKPIIYNGSVVFIAEKGDEYVFGVNYKDTHKFIITDLSCDAKYESRWFEGNTTGKPLSEVNGITSVTKVTRVIR